MSDRLYLGVDGGGTGCRAALGDGQGLIVGRGEAGPANITSNPAESAKNIVSACEQAVAASGLPELKLSHLPACLGLAGANIDSALGAVLSFLPFERTHIVQDTHTALQGALGDDEGSVCIVGTGSVVITRRGGEISTVGGWGFPVGDLSGGAQLGLALLQQTLLATEMVRPASDLSDQVLAEFDGKPDQLAELARFATPAQFGRFAPMIVEAHAGGDPIAKHIVALAVRDLNAALESARKDEAAPLSLIGGLAQFYGDKISAKHQSVLVEPRGKPLDGALALARQIFGT
ncbi:MAG: BadF/BadG/BcrA/BcrD ATPase family protein [Pseudomonadota bacterium]